MHPIYVEPEVQWGFELLKSASVLVPILSVWIRVKPWFLNRISQNFPKGLYCFNFARWIVNCTWWNTCPNHRFRQNRIMRFLKSKYWLYASFKESRQYLKGGPNRPKSLFCNYHQTLESFMPTKQLTQWKSWWIETLDCFDFNINFWPGRQSTKPDSVSQQPDRAA